MSNFETAFAAFLAAAQAKVTADFTAFSPTMPVPQLSTMPGRRYVRIVVESHGQRSAWGFVDSTNGDVLKTDGWKSPAKNFARGNIYDAQNGCGRVRWTGVA